MNQRRAEDDRLHPHSGTSDQGRVEGWSQFVPETEVPPSVDHLDEKLEDGD